MSRNEPLQTDVPRRVRRVLVVDDNEATHHDIQKILVRRKSTLDDMESALFGEAPVEEPDAFEIHSAFQGQEGLAAIQRSILEGHPYELAIVDYRMPPGWDGIETIGELWKVDPLLQVVLCAAYLGQSREEVIRKLGRAEGLSILPKPFESAELLRLASALTDRCWLQRKEEVLTARG